MSTPSYISDHAAQAVAKLAEQYKSKLKLAGLLGAFTAQNQAVEDALAGASTGIQGVLAIASSAGAQLDLIGRLVGQPRNGLVDADYRLWLKARIAANLGSGAAEEIYGVFSLLVTAGQTLAIVEQAPGFVLRIFGAALTQSAAALAALLSAAKAAGVYGRLEYLSTTPAATFTWDGTSGQAWDNGAFATAL